MNTFTYEISIRYSENNWTYCPLRPAGNPIKICKNWPFQKKSFQVHVKWYQITNSRYISGIKGHNISPPQPHCENCLESSHLTSPNNQHLRMFAQVWAHLHTHSCSGVSWHLHWWQLMLLPSVITVHIGTIYKLSAP